MTKIIAIIVAAGKGLRMKDTKKKQYQCVAGLPIVVHTLKVFDACMLVDEIILVVPEEDLDFCRTNIVRCAELAKPVHLVPGGPQRQDSVYNGLKVIATDDDAIVVVHDGVRPFITAGQIEACVQLAKQWGACILGMPVGDTVKCVGSDGIVLQTLERDAIWFAQTPQVFRYKLIKDAHERAQKRGITGTDDASLVEQLGTKVKILQGHRYNIKITHPEDLELARLLLRHCE